MENKGVISENSLMAKLAQAKKVMSVVDSGKFKTGQINDAAFNMNEDYVMEKPVHNIQRNSDAPNIDKINNSKLPDSIKKAMIERPISQPNINLNESLDVKLFEGAKRLIDEDIRTSKPNNVQQPIRTRQQVVENRQPQVSAQDLASQLTPIIENVVRRVLDEKLTQILAAHDSGTINENLVLKVGDSIFSGKITNVKNTKK